MIDDHTKANSGFFALAAKQGVTLANDLDKKLQVKLDKLGSAADKDFAKDYFECHEKTLKQAVYLFTAESQDEKDTRLRVFAAQTLPTLMVHVDHVMRLPPASECRVLVAGAGGSTAGLHGGATRGHPVLPGTARAGTHCESGPDALLVRIGNVSG